MVLQHIQCKFTSSDYVYSTRRKELLRVFGSDEDILNNERWDFRAYNLRDIQSLDSDAWKERARAHLTEMLTPQMLLYQTNRELNLNTSVLLDKHAFELASELLERYPDDQLLADLVQNRETKLRAETKLGDTTKMQLQKHLRNLWEFQMKYGGPLDFVVDFAQRHAIDTSEYLPPPTMLDKQLFPEANKLLQSAWKNPKGSRHITPVKAFNVLKLQQYAPDAIGSDAFTFISEIQNIRDKLAVDVGTDILEPPLTNAAAKHRVKVMAKDFPGNVIATQLASIALGTHDLTVNVSPLPNIFYPVYASFYDEQYKLDIASKSKMLGTSDKYGNIVDFALGDTEAGLTLLHELSHYGIGVIYNNNDQVPWLDGEDERRTLFIDACRADLYKNKKSAKTIKALCHDLGMPDMTAFEKPEEAMDFSKKILHPEYRGMGFFAEVPVRMIESEAAGKWDATKRERWPHLTRFMTDIIGGDIKQFKQFSELQPMIKAEAEIYRQKAPRSWLDDMRERKEVDARLRGK